MIFLVGVCLVNLFISFLNARSCGLIWCESKAIGGWVRFLVWCGAIQSAVGFTSVYMVVAVVIASKIGYLDIKSIRLFVDMVYLLIVIPLIGSGLAITVHSWIRLARERNLSSLSVAGWNTFAQARNMYSAYRAFGPAVESVAKAFGGFGNSKRKNANVVMLAIFVLVLGVLTTAVIIRRYAGELKVPEEIERKFSPNLSAPLSKREAEA